MPEKSAPAPVTQRELLEKISENYYALYLFDLTTDRVTPLKRSEEMAALTPQEPQALRGYFVRAGLPLVEERFRGAVEQFLSPENMRTLAAGSRAMLLYQQTSGGWKKIVLQPVRMRAGQAAVVLAALTDVTDTKRQADALMEESTAQQRRAAAYARLFLDAARDTYTEVVRADAVSGCAWRLCLSGEELDAVPVDGGWAAWFAALTARAHPADRNVLQTRLAGGRLEELSPDSRAEATLRVAAGGENEAWHWNTLVLHTAPAKTETLCTLPRFSAAADVLDPCGQWTTVLVRDITDEMNERERLKDLSEHDRMTDLFNRTKLEAMTAGEYSALASCGVLYFDVNGLKETNDLLGHEAGDALIQQVADSLRSIASRRVHAYRLGGDEFMAVVCSPAAGEMERLITLWNARMRTLAAASGIACSAAVGSAVGTAPVDLAQLMKQADAAMYRNKQQMKAGRAR